jgi:hypothetical protein
MRHRLYHWFIFIQQGIFDKDLAGLPLSDYER